VDGLTFTTTLTTPTEISHIQFKLQPATKQATEASQILCKILNCNAPLRVVVAVVAAVTLAIVK